MPCLRQVSPTFAPASTSLRIRTICSSLNFDFFMQSSLGGNSTSNWLESVRTLHAALRPRRRCMTASSLDLSSRRELGLLADLVQATRDLLHCIQDRKST